VHSEIRSERRGFSSREGSGYESASTVWSEDRLSIGSVHKFVAKFREMLLAIVFFHSHMFQT